LLAQETGELFVTISFPLTATSSQPFYSFYRENLYFPLVLLPKKNFWLLGENYMKIALPVFILSLLPYTLPHAFCLFQREGMAYLLY
jgi:hypothetical protein